MKKIILYGYLNKQNTECHCIRASMIYHSTCESGPSCDLGSQEAITIFIYIAPSVVKVFDLDFRPTPSYRKLVCEILVFNHLTEDNTVE